MRNFRLSKISSPPPCSTEKFAPRKCNARLTVGAPSGTVCVAGFRGADNRTTRLGDSDMSDKDEIVKKIEEGIKGAAKAVEDFADKVAAPEEPVVIIPDEDAPPPKSKTDKG